MSTDDRHMHFVEQCSHKVEFKVQKGSMWPRVLDGENAVEIHMSEISSPLIYVLIEIFWR